MDKTNTDISIDNLELFANQNKVGDPNKNENEIISIKPESLKEDDFNLDQILGNIDSDTNKVNTSSMNINSNSSQGTNNISVNLTDDLKLDDLKLDNMNEVKLDDNIFSLNNESKQELKDNTSSSSQFTNSSPLNNIPSPPNPESQSNVNFNYDNRPKTEKELKKEKFELLCNLERFETRGIKVSKIFSMESDYDEMKQEYERIKRKLDVDKSIKFQQKMLIAFVLV